MTGLTFYGLNHYSGTSVSVWLAGLYCGDYVVPTTGKITVPYLSDPDALLTADFLKVISDNPPDTGPWPYATTILVTLVDTTTVTVTVPCVIGGLYTSDGQTLRPLAQADSKTGSGPSLAMVRRPFQMGAVLANTTGTQATDHGISFGATFDNLRPAEFASPGGTGYTTIDLKTGVHWAPIEGDSDFDGALAWRVTGPYPATVAAFSGFERTAER